MGLTDVLVGRAELVDVLQKWGRGRSTCCRRAAFRRTRASCWGRPPWRPLLATLTEQFDYVFIDAPPLLLVTDAAVV